MRIDNVDWAKARDRHEAWWHGEVIDRALLQVFAPRTDVPDVPAPEYKAQVEKWLDPDYRIRLFEWNMARTYYAGDAFPYLDTHIGPGTLSTYIGAKPELTDRTVWYHPSVTDISSAVPPEFDESNVYWQTSLAFAKEGVRRLAGRALVSFPDLIENLDTISSLFGNRALLFALLDHPEKVHEFQRAIVPLYDEYHRRLYDIIKEEDCGGSCFSAFRVYGRGRIAKLQCDFSAMISATMFKEFVVPYMEQQCQLLDHTVYHWDGPCALQHEEPLLRSLPSLKAIQWTPGAGQPGIGARCWFPMYERVRSAGKSLLLLGVTASEAEDLVGHFGPEGLSLIVWASSQAEADDIVRRSFTWWKR